ncbi:hypothetical protein BGX38DRAFT_1185641 [Terfezia claveryi]|nr:hypothetical protein BGX38DRAFT_1185641 [Terfezia claveryi]
MPELIYGYRNTYSGRVDYAIGLVKKGALMEVKQGGKKAIRLPYKCYLLVVEEKRAMDMDGAVAQLFGYMAIPHKLCKGSSSNLIDKGIYGIATDGLIIDGEGFMKRGPRIDIGEGLEHIHRVVRAMLYSLEKELDVMNQEGLAGDPMAGKQDSKCGDKSGTRCAPKYPTVGLVWLQSGICLRNNPTICSPLWMANSPKYTCLVRSSSFYI